MCEVWLSSCGFTSSDGDPSRALHLLIIAHLPQDRRIVVFFLSLSPSPFMFFLRHKAIMSFCKSDCLVISHVLATGVPRGALREVRRVCVCVCVDRERVPIFVRVCLWSRNDWSPAEITYLWEKMLIKCQTLLIYRSPINPDQTAAGIIQLEYVFKHWSRVSLRSPGFVLQHYEETCHAARRSGAITLSLFIHLFAGFSSFIPFSSLLLIALAANSLSLISLFIFPTVFSLPSTLSQISLYTHGAHT